MFIPPPPNREQRVAEAAGLHQLTDNRDDADTARALVLNKRGGWGLWQDEASALRERMPGVRGWAVTARMTSAMATAFVGSQIAKLRYGAERPWELDPTIVPLDHPRDRSYPSGHSTAAAAAYAVLAPAEPEFAPARLKLKQDVEWARGFSGVHLPSDIAAGDAFGTRVGRVFAPE